MTLNLVQHRSGPSVWTCADTSTMDVERWLLNTASAAIIATGLRNRSVAGMLLVVGGGLLAWWAAAGADERRARSARVRAALPRRRRIDTVGEASEESFPASDPPSWTSTTGHTSPSQAASRRH